VNTVDDYFSSLTRFFRKHKGIVGLEPEFPYQRITDHFGRVNAAFAFSTAPTSTLHILGQIEST